MPKTTVFVGPSLPRVQVRKLLPHADIRQPIARGELYLARQTGAELIVILDGVFSHDLAVSPREVVDVLGDGAVVLGASSMGAIRAADCWPAGMRGIGTVYRLYRLGVLSSDDAVAVATDPDRDYAAVSLALVNVSVAVRRAKARRLLGSEELIAIEAAAKRTFFAQRVWPGILAEAGVRDSDGTIRTFCEQVDVKRADALMAIREAACAEGGEPIDPAYPPLFARPLRYAGHDPLLGVDVVDTQRELLHWLFGSGRYQRYVWPMVVGEPEFSDLPSDPEMRAMMLRERLAGVLARLLRHPETLAACLVGELSFLEEFNSEVMRWYALKQVAQEKIDEGRIIRSHTIAATREIVAVLHGYSDWSALIGDVEDGRAFGAIPMAWIEEACVRLAQARC